MDNTTKVIGIFIAAILVISVLASIAGLASAIGFFYQAEEGSENIGKNDSSGNGQILVSETDIEAVIGEGADLDGRVAFRPPPVEVPTLTPIGLIALVGLLAAVAAITISIRKRR